jgi:hypothetical protein
LFARVVPAPLGEQDSDYALTKFVDYLCGIAMKATDSAGVMEAESGPVVVFIMLKDLRWTHGAA